MSEGLNQCCKCNGPLTNDPHIKYYGNVLCPSCTAIAVKIIVENIEKDRKYDQEDN